MGCFISWSIVAVVPALLADATTHAEIPVQIHAQQTLAEMAATAAGGLLSSYSFVADVATTVVHS